MARNWAEEYANAREAAAAKAAAPAAATSRDWTAEYQNALQSKLGALEQQKLRQDKIDAQNRVNAYKLQKEMEQARLANKNMTEAAQKMSEYQKTLNPTTIPALGDVSSQRAAAASYPRLSIGERVGQTLAGLQEGTPSQSALRADSSPRGGARAAAPLATANTADQYGRGVIQNKIDELRNKGLQTDENGLGYFDTPEGEAELNAGLRELQSALRVLTGQDVTISGLAAAQDVLDSTPTINWGRWAQVDANAGQAMQAIEDRKDTEARSDYEDYYNDWLHLMEREDFAEKSRYRSTATGEEYKPGAAIFGSSGFGDLMYDYINKNQTAVERQQLLDTTSGFSALGLDQSFLQTMNDTEVGIYNYLYATEGRDRANEYLKYIQSSLTARQRQQTQDSFRQYAQENPVKASAFSVLQAPARGLAYLGQAADLLTDGRIDQNAAYNKFADIPSTIRETVSQNWGPEGSFLYQTGMSMADFLLTLGISGGSNLSLAIMGSGAAADTVIDAKDRGLSDAQAFTLGTVAGVAEALTEKVSIESLLDMTTLGKSAVGYIVKNALAEAGEEASSGIINLLTDIIVSRDKSQWQQEIDRYFAQGMTKKQAVNLALMNQAKSIGLDTLGGALSGGLLAGGGAITNRVGEVQRQQDQLQSGMRLYGTLQELQEAAETPSQSPATPVPALPEGEPRADAGNQQRVDISPAVNQQGFEQAQNMPVQNNAQAETANADIMETPVETREQTALTPTITVETDAEGNPLESEYPEEWYFGGDSGNYMDILETDPAYQELQREAAAGGIATEEVYENNIRHILKNNPEAAAAYEAEQVTPARQLIAEIEQRGAETLAEMTELRRAREVVREWEETYVEGGYERQNLDYGSEERGPGTGAREQAGSVEGGAGRFKPIDHSRAAGLRRHRISNLRVKEESLSNYGAQIEAEARVYPEEMWDGGMRSTAARMEELGHKVIFVNGPVRIDDVNVNGINDMNGTIVVQADSTKYTIDQIADHELFHSELRDNPGLLDKIVERIKERYTEEQFNRVVQRYITNERGIINVEDGMDDAAYEEALRRIYEEIACDAWAEKNSFGAGANKLTEEVRAVAADAGVAREAERGTHETRGPPMYSVSDETDSEGDELSVEQAENIDNRTLTSDPDIRHSVADEDYNESAMQYYAMQAQQEQERAAQKKEQRAQKRKERQSRLWAGGEIKSNSIYKGKPTRELLKTFPTKYSQEDFRNELMRIFSTPKGMIFEAKSVIRPYIQKILDKGTLDDTDANMLFSVMYNYGEVEKPKDEYVKDLGSAVRGARIYVHDSVKSDFGGREEWSAFHRRAFAAGIFLTNDTANPGVDEWNKEMAQLFPGEFDANDVQAREILEHIVAIAEEGKVENVNLYEYADIIANEYGRETAEEMYENMWRQFDQAIKRFADKAGLEVRMQAKTEFYKARERVQLEEQRKAARKERDRKELQQKILKEIQYLKKNRKKSNAEWQKRFDDVLTGIDTYAASALPRKGIYSKKYNMTWEDIAKSYDEWSKEPDFLPNEDLKRIVSRVKDKKLADMTVEDLEELLKTAVAIHTEYDNYQNMIVDGIKTRTSRVYNQLVEEVKNADNARKEHGKLQQLMNLNQLTPMNIIQRVGGWNPDSMWMKLAKNLEQGEREQKAYVIRANNLLRDFMTKNKKWVERADGQTRNAKWYELTLPKYTEAGAGNAPIDSGETVTVYMTPAMKVHLFLESKNPMNLYHIEHGGRKFVTDKKLYRTNRNAAMQEGTVVKLTPQAVREIVKDMTPEEMELANTLHSYYNGMSREEINRVSNRLYGYDKAINEEYAPIWTDKDFAKQEPGVYNVTAEGVGSLKERLGYAATQTLNISAFDAFNKSVDETSRFVGLSIPVKNWNTVMNWNKKVNQDETTPLVTAVRDAWGSETAEYLRDLTKDYQQPYADKQTPLDGLVGSLTSNYIASVFASNPSVVLKQLGSYPMAMAYLGASNAPSPAQIHRTDPSIIEKYSPELDARLMGYDIPEVAQVRNKKKWTQRNKVIEATMGGGWITAMDGWVAKTLWPWAENKVRSETDLEYGTDEFYKRVAQEFDNAVVRSQSINDFMHRSNLMKSTNAATRTFTMFKSDSAQSYNMLREKFGVVQYMKEHGTEEQQKRASLDAAQAVLGILANSTWSTLVTIVAGLLKYGLANFKDDEDEFSWAEVGKDVAENMVSNLAGVAIGGQELVDLIAPIIRKERYWGIEEMGSSRLNDFLTEINNAGVSILAFGQELAALNKEDGDWEEFVEENSDMVISTVKDIAWTAGRYFAGLPIENLEKYLLGLMRFAFPKAVMAIENLQSKPTKASLKGLEGETLQYQVGSILDNIAGGATEETVEELSRLYELNDIPTETVEMTPKQEQQYRLRVEEILSEHLDYFVASPRYEKMDDEERGDMLNWLNSYANKTAKSEVLGTEVEPITEKINTLLEKGMEMPEALAAYDEYVRAEKLLDAGLDPELSADVVQAIHEEEDANGPDVDLNDLERYEIMLEHIGNETARYAAMAGLMGEKERARFQSGHDWVSSETYVRFLREWKTQYPEDDKSQEKVKKLLKEMDLENDERAALWQMCNKGWKWEKNPFDRSIGKEIASEIESKYKEIDGE